MSDRCVLLVTHTGRGDAVEVARAASRLLRDSGIEVRAPAEEAAELGL